MNAFLSEIEMHSFFYIVQLHNNNLNAIIYKTEKI